MSFMSVEGVYVARRRRGGSRRMWELEFEQLQQQQFERFDLHQFERLVNPEHFDVIVHQRFHCHGGAETAGLVRQG